MVSRGVLDSCFFHLYAFFSSAAFTPQRAATTYPQFVPPFHILYLRTRGSFFLLLRYLGYLLLSST